MAQKTGLGTTLTFGTTTTYTPKKVSISGPSISRDPLETSHFGTTGGAKTKTADDLYDGGEVQVDVFWDPLDGYPPVTAVPEVITITHNDSGTATEVFTGFVSGFDKSVGLGELMKATLTIAVCTAITFTP
jgi:hypothetical protein